MKVFKLSLSFVLLLFSYGIKAHTLEESIQAALDRSPDFLVSAAGRKAADARLNQSYGGLLPRVDIAAGYGRDKNNNSLTRAAVGGSRTLNRRESSLTLTQLLFDGFLVVNTIEERAYLVKSAAYTVYGAAEDVSLRVAETYLEVLRRQKLVNLAKNNLNAHSRIFEQIEKRSKSGVGRLADLDQARGRLALARTNLLAEQANLRDAQTNFLRVTGFETHSLVHPHLPNDALPESMEAAVLMAVEYHPLLRSNIANVQSKCAKRRSTRAPFMPNLNLELSGSDNRNLSGSPTKSTSLTGMLKLSFNLFRGGQDYALAREAAWQYEESKEQRNQARRQIEQGVRLSWNAYTNARAQLKFYKEYANSAERTKEAYQKQFDIGQRTLLDLLDSENEVFTAKSAFISTQFTELLGRYRVLNGMGKMVDYLKIRVPKAAYYERKGWFSLD